MQCTKCGAAIAADSRFCSTCGHEVRSDQRAGKPSPEDQVKIGELVYAAYRHKDMGSVDDAILACQGALALDQDNPRAHALLGSLCELKGDTAAAIHEYEKAVELDPESAADRRKLEDLKSGRLAQPAGPRAANTFDNLTPYTPLAAAVVTLIIVLIVSVLLLQNSAGRSARTPGTEVAGAPTAQGNVPQAAPPVQPQYPQGQYYQPYPGQGQQPPALPRAGGSTSPSQGVPPVSLPQPAAGAPGPSGQSPPGESRPPDETPVIVPVIEPEPGRPAGTGPGPSGSSPPGMAPAPSPSPIQPDVDPEKRGLELQRAGRHREAIAAYRQAMSQTNDQGRIYQQIALCYQRLGEDDLAVDAYDRAIRSYREQLAAGRDPSEVQRSIRSCEAGVEVIRSQAG